jgi:hypothetical protein
MRQLVILGQLVGGVERRDERCRRFVIGLDQRR